MKPGRSRTSSRPCLVLGRSRRRFRPIPRASIRAGIAKEAGRERAAATRRAHVGASTTGAFWVGLTDLWSDLTDQQWAVVESLLPKPEVREDGRGRPWCDPRDVLNGILWIHRTGAPWADMPSRYPPYATCFRRFQMWVKDGVLQKVLQALCDDLVERGRLDLSEAFIDGSHAALKKGPPGAQNSARVCHQARCDRRPLWSSNICHHRFG